MPSVITTRIASGSAPITEHVAVRASLVGAPSPARAGMFHDNTREDFNAPDDQDDRRLAPRHHRLWLHLSFGGSVA